MVKKVTTGGDYPAEIVTNANSQVVDPAEKSKPKRLSEAYLRDPAKPRARNGENRSHAATPKTIHARQGDRGGGESEPQGHLKWPPHGLKGRNQPPSKRASQPDFTGWANWLSTQPGWTKFEALKWIGEEIDRIAEKRGVDSVKAGAILDRELKRRRQLAGAAP